MQVRTIARERIIGFRDIIFSSTCRYNGYFLNAPARLYLFTFKFDLRPNAVVKFDV